MAASYTNVVEFQGRFYSGEPNSAAPWNPALWSPNKLEATGFQTEVEAERIVRAINHRFSPLGKTAQVRPILLARDQEVKVVRKPRDERNLP